MSTYRDMVDVERCSACHAAIRARDGEPMVSLPLRLVDELITNLEKFTVGGYMGRLKLNDYGKDVLADLERAAGRSREQIQAAATHDTSTGG